MKPYSATELDTARGCLRKWAGKYASDWPRVPPGSSAALGIEGHGHAERYLKDGVAPPDTGIGQLVRAGLPFLPPPGSGEVEKKTTFTLDEGLPFVRVLDWRGPAYELPGVDCTLLDGPLAQLDHKFTKDPRRYGLWSDEDFLNNIQAVVYRLSEGDVPVFQRWLYYPTGSGRRVKPSDHALAYRDTRGAYERIVLPIVQAIEPWRGRKVDPNDVPGNSGHCDAYGGCDYRKLGVCNMTTAQVVANYFTLDGEETMATPDNSIWKKLALNGGNAAPAPAASAAAPAAPVFKFEFPASVAATAAAIAEVSKAPSVLTEAPPAVEAPAPEKPKKTRTRKEEEPEPRTAINGGLPPLTEHVPQWETLRLIGRAMIAAGKVLAGE